MSVLTPNAAEVLRLGAASVHDLLTSGLGALIVTHGAEGVDVYTHGDVHRIPAFSVNVVDTVGAGDAFSAGVAVGLACGEGLEVAVRLGLASAAIAVTGTGARGTPISMTAVRGLIERADPSGFPSTGHNRTSRLPPDH